MNKHLLKITHITGLSEVVCLELSLYPQYTITQKNPDNVYIETTSDLSPLLGLRSVLQVYLTRQDLKYHPSYLCNHKSILGEMIELVVSTPKKSFKTFSLNCAGSESSEVRSIKRYITDHFHLSETDDADMKIYIGKIGTIWEVGVSMSPTSLSMRGYKHHHIPGGINPSVAYAINNLCELETKTTYLNIFSGSATLPIEAALQYPHLSYAGIENNKETISKSIQNIQRAGLIKNISITYADIHDNPELGMFDVITADVPFGMQIGKNTDIKNLYEKFCTYAEDHLSDDGVLAIYTSEVATMKQCLKNSVFTIERELPLKIVTSVNSYLYPSILICKKNT